jgi:hypothetical protein
MSISTVQCTAGWILAASNLQELNKTWFVPTEYDEEALLLQKEQQLKGKLMDIRNAKAPTPTGVIAKDEDQKEEEEIEEDEEEEDEEEEQEEEEREEEEEVPDSLDDSQLPEISQQEVTHCRIPRGLLNLERYPLISI